MDFSHQLLVLVAVFLLTYGVYRLRQQFRFWADRNVPYLKNKLAFNDKSIHPAKHFQNWYNEFKGQHSFMGLILAVKPIAVALDLELIRCILVKDFHHFQNRGLYYNEKDDPLSAHLLSLEGAKWRSLRAKISPTFTSGKMKMMYPTMVAAGKQFSDYLNEKVAQDSELEMKDVLSRFTTDMIGTCAFGIECNTMKEPNSKFLEMGRKHFEAPRSTLLDTFKMVAPRLARLFGVKEIRPEVSEFFMGVVRDTIDYRLKNGVHRKDFMDLLITMMKDESLGSDRITFNEIAAQAYVFFIAGFETSSTTMTWALYELSVNPDIQEKGRKCVRQVLDRHNGVMSYEAIMEMTYIDQIINETLRKYPPVPLHFRTTTSEYKVPDTDTLLPAGLMVIVPVYSIQHDPEIFPDPKKFDPDRFTAEEVNKRHPFAWLPFGEGPRICIGLRFGMMQARIGLALLLQSFRFSIGPKSKLPLEFEPTNLILSPKHGLWLQVEKI